MEFTGMSFKQPFIDVLPHDMSTFLLTPFRNVCPHLTKDCTYLSHVCHTIKNTFFLPFYTLRLQTNKTFFFLSFLFSL